MNNHPTDPEAAIVTGCDALLEAVCHLAAQVAQDGESPATRRALAEALTAHEAAQAALGTLGDRT